MYGITDRFAQFRTRTLSNWSALALAACCPRQYSYIENKHITTVKGSIGSTWSSYRCSSKKTPSMTFPRQFLLFGSSPNARQKNIPVIFGTDPV